MVLDNTSPFHHERALGERVHLSLTIPIILYGIMSSEADIAVLKSKVEDLEQNQNILFERVRLNEKWVAGAGAIIAACTAIVGIVVAVDAQTRTEVIKTTAESTEVCLSQKSCKNIEKREKMA